MGRPNRSGFVSRQPPQSGRPLIDPPETRRPAYHQTEHEEALCRTKTADRNAQSYRVTDSLPVEDIRIRIDDRFRVHRLTAHGVGIIGNWSGRPKRKKRHRDVVFHCKVPNGDHPAFAAETQAWGSPGTASDPQGHVSGISDPIPNHVGWALCDAVRRIRSDLNVRRPEATYPWRGLQR